MNIDNTARIGRVYRKFCELAKTTFAHDDSCVETVWSRRGNEQLVKERLIHVLNDTLARCLVHGRVMDEVPVPVRGHLRPDNPAGRRVFPNPNQSGRADIIVSFHEKLEWVIEVKSCPLLRLRASQNCVNVHDLVQDVANNANATISDRRTVQDQFLLLDTETLKDMNTVVPRCGQSNRSNGGNVGQEYEKKARIEDDQSNIENVRERYILAKEQARRYADARMGELGDGAVVFFSVVYLVGARLLVSPLEQTIRVCANEAPLPQTECMRIQHMAVTQTLIEFGESYGDGVCTVIAPCLMERKCCVTDLRLRDHTITEKGLVTLADALTHMNCNLTTLCLTSNQISDWSSLATALKHPNCRLLRLELCGDRIGDTGVFVIGQVALTFIGCDLMMLRIHSCSISDTGASIIGEFVRSRQLHPLYALDVSNEAGSRLQRWKLPTLPSSTVSPSPTHVVHRTVECNVCKMFPIEGSRFKCQICHDYDLCIACNNAQMHEHTMEQITVPTYSPRSKLNYAEFDRDVARLMALGGFACDVAGVALDKHQMNVEQAATEFLLTQLHQRLQPPPTVVLVATTRRQLPAFIQRQDDEYNDLYDQYHEAMGRVHIANVESENSEEDQMQLAAAEIAAFTRAQQAFLS